LANPAQDMLMCVFTLDLLAARCCSG